jgi:glucose-1-phosphate thymidylyltransferase
MRGVILAGGYGTRMMPCTKVTNKHLLPVYTDKGAVPMIHFPIRTLVGSGIENILIVSSRQHSGDIIEHIGDGYEFGADISYKIQDMNRVQLGIASALKIAQDYTKDEKLAVILGDNFFEEEFPDEFDEFHYGNKHDAFVFLKQVHDPTRFGIIKWKGGQFDNVETILEKPTNPPTNFAVTGLYLFTKAVYSIAEDLKPSERGELEIVDIINYCIESGYFGHHHLEGFWSDMGTPDSMRRTQEFLNHG